MELIPVKQASAVADNNKVVEMSPNAIALADVQTSVVTAAGVSAKGIYLTGKIMMDQRNLYTPTAQFDGRVEKLYVNFTGQHVYKGEVLASVYSPDLINAQQELLVALSYKNSNPAMYQAAHNKLKYWQIADKEIDKIEKNGKIVESLPIQAANSGIVMKLNVAVGDRIKTGDVLYEIADLNSLWVMMDAYEQDLGLISKGDMIEFTVPSMPDKVYRARVSFIDPVIDPQTRIAKVRAEISNLNGELKPEMFVRGKVEANVNVTGGLLIPQSAILWTGKRSLVYVKVPGAKTPTFEYREVNLGPEVGDDYIITGGLKAGEEVVTNGAFTIDASAQLSGKASMMEPNGGVSGGSMPGMPGMKMGGDKTTKPIGKNSGSGSMGGMKM
jgi:Cu(I)/Ag(I) efflux system membrane fusion protein